MKIYFQTSSLTKEQLNPFRLKQFRVSRLLLFYHYIYLLAYSQQSPLAFPVVNEGDELHIRQGSFVFIQAPEYITTAAEDPELIVKWIDWLYSPEGSHEIIFGVMGDDRYEDTYYLDEDGNPQYAESTLTPDGNRHLLLRDIQTVWEEYSQKLQYTDPRNEIGWDEWGKADQDYMMPQTLSMTLDENDEFSKIMQDINTYVPEMTARFILGTEPLDNYDEFQATSIDGANRFQQVFCVTLPGIAPTIVTLFILRIGRIMNVGWKKIVLLSNSAIKDSSQLIPGAIVATNLLIMRTGFMAVPDSLLESARIDGANDFTILHKIILPLSKPTLAVIGLYYGVSHWNSWLKATIYLRDRELFPLQLFLRETLLQSQIDETVIDNPNMIADLSEVIKYSTIIVAIVPVLMVYPFLQNFFVKGVMLGAIKG